MILDVLDVDGEYDIHPIDYWQYYPVSLTVAKEYPSYQGIAFHKEISQLRGRQLEQTK